MEIFKIDGLLLFVTFFIPGFISIKIFDLLLSAEERDFSKSLFEVIAYSCLNYAATSWIIIIIFLNKIYIFYPWLFLVLVIIIIFLFPVIWPLLIIKIYKSKLLSRYLISPYRKPWDYVFSKRESYWIIVHLKDGRRIGGKYDVNSFSSSYPSEEQIYLEEVWNLDKESKFKKLIERSKGILILNSEILAIEFFK